MSNSILRAIETCCNGYNQSKRFWAKIFTTFLFFAFIVHFNGRAQGFLASPACNISGPLEAVASGSDITITIKVAHSTPSPKLSYEFGSNSSNAFIRTKGDVFYDPISNMASQQLTVSPGTTGSEFNLKLEVSTPSGISSCSKSVSVTSSSAGSAGGSSSGSGSGSHGSTPGH